MASWNEYDIYIMSGNRELLWGTVYDEETAKEYSKTISGWYKVRIAYGSYSDIYCLDADIAFGG